MFICPENEAKEIHLKIGTMLGITFIRFQKTWVFFKIP
jgi:hypothetical protein